MLAKVNRLRKKRDFDAVFASGRGVKIGHYLFTCASSKQGESRVGFVVGKKVSPLATVRNKVKRRLRQAVAGCLWQVKKPVDLVVVALPGSQHDGMDQVRLVVTRFFNKLQ